jgi:hypothetical protein
MDNEIIENVPQLEQEQQIIETPEVATPQQQDNNQQISVDDVKAGKVNFFELPTQEKKRIEKELISQYSPEDQAFIEATNWKPKELFKGLNRDGSPREWTPLDKFKQNYLNNPALRAERERALERRLEAMNSQVEKISRLNQIKLEKEHKALEAKINRELQEAESIGDLDSYKSALQRKQELDAERNEINQIAAPQQQQIDPYVEKQVKEFRDRNPWYGIDQEVTQYSIKQFDLLNQARPDLGVKEKLEIIEKNAREIFSHKIPNQNRIMPVIDTPKNAGTFTTNKPATNQIQYTRLPEDEQRRVDQLAKLQRLSREEIIKKYFKK